MGPRMFEIINQEGRILGLCTRGVRQELRHGEIADVRLMEPALESYRDFIASSPSDDPALSYSRINFRIHEMRILEGGYQTESRWYLVALGEIPDEVWRAANFIRVEWDRPGERL